MNIRRCSHCARHTSQGVRFNCGKNHGLWHTHCCPKEYLPHFATFGGSSQKLRNASEDTLKFAGLSIIYTATNHVRPGLPREFTPAVAQLELLLMKSEVLESK